MTEEKDRSSLIAGSAVGINLLLLCALLLWPAVSYLMDPEYPVPPLDYHIWATLKIIGLVLGNVMAMMVASRMGYRTLYHSLQLALLILAIVCIPLGYAGETITREAYRKAVASHEN